MSSPESIPILVDRTGKIFPKPEIQIITPMGKLCAPLLIDEICAKRANYILEKANRRKIFVCYSGGIDSTLVLTEMMKVAENDQIEILLNENSIAEYPWFYHKYINGKYRTHHFDFYSDQLMTELLVDGIFVNGLLMDPTTGADNYLSIPKDRLLLPIDSIFKWIKESRELYVKLIECCPRKLESIKDLMWWLDYTLNYQNEELIHLLTNPNLIPDKNIFYFGGGSDWNDWAMSTPAEIKWPGVDNNRFKYSIKKHIESFTSDREYTEQKTKVFSWRRYRNPLERMKQKCIYIDVKWNRD